MEIVGRTGQSVYDINLMVYSGFDNIVKFIKDNGIPSLNDLDVKGLTMTYNPNNNNNLSLNSIINSRGYVFTTGVFKSTERSTEDELIRITEEGYTREI